MNPINCQIVNGEIVIRIPVADLPMALECSNYAENFHDGDGQCGLKITDLNLFAQEVAGGLLHEQENGETPIHRLFEKVFASVIEGGCDGIEVEEADS